MQASEVRLRRKEVMRIKRSPKARVKHPIEQVLDAIGPRLKDAEDFFLTDLDIRVGKDPKDIPRAASEILRRVRREQAPRRRKK